MERVVGIGGVFLKARDPNGLANWYREHLGVPTDEHGETMFSSAGEPGAVLVWSPFPADTTYFEPSKSTT